MVSLPDDLRVWQRAAVLGSLWAAVEIVAGSFLHNLSVPFAGTVLAAFGVIVMTAGHRAWPERGLIWRTALVCALMKSVSPSAVILGPMIGILTEGMLLEACVRLLGGTPAGYVLGGALAVAWPLGQKILSALIAFGPNLVRLYVEAFAYASKVLGVSRIGPFDLVAALFAVQSAVGVAAAVAGLSLARRVQTAAIGPARPVTTAAPNRDPFQPQAAWSLASLVAFAAGLVGGMVLIGFLALPLAALYVGLYAALVFRTYRRALGRLMRPVFWLQGAGVVLLAALLLGGLRDGTAGLVRGLEAGVQMLLRAVLVVFGFTAVSVELRNPRILAWLERRRLRGLSDALGLAFGALPAFTEVLADQRGFWRRPLATLAEMFQTAGTLYVSRGSNGRRLVILTGRTGSGKTTLAAAAVEVLRRRGVTVGGVLAPGLLADGRRTGFDIVDLSTGRTALLCREHEGDGPCEQRWGRFRFTREGLALGLEALTVHGLTSDVIVVDEIGPLELAGGGWADALNFLIGRFQGLLLVIARVAVVDAVKARWGNANTPVCEVGVDGAERIADVVAGRLAASPARPPDSAAESRRGLT